MKRCVFTLWFLLMLCADVYAIHVDSLKIVPASDTTYYLAVYGLLTPRPPCIIVDSEKFIGADNVDVWLCYIANSSATVGCSATDSVYIGKLPNPNYAITLYVAITDSPLTNTCQTTTRRDTFQLQYSVTGFYELNDRQVNIFPNPVKDVLSIELINEIEAEATIISMQGQVLKKINLHGSLSNIPVKDLPQGVYMLYMHNKERHWVKRFVKE